MTPDKLLESYAQLYREKNAEHGQSWQKIGDQCVQYFPNGIELKTAEDFNAFYLFIMLQTKMNRLSSSLLNSDHLLHESKVDSSRDLSVYAAMNHSRLMHETTEANIDKENKQIKVHVFNSDGSHEIFLFSSSDDAQKFARVHTQNPKSKIAVIQQPYTADQYVVYNG